jgi:hypothetical protein
LIGRRPRAIIVERLGTSRSSVVNSSENRKGSGKGGSQRRGRRETKRDEANIVGPPVLDFSFQVEPNTSVSDQSLDIVTKLGYITDSGTTNHIVGERERFVKYKQFKNTIRTADRTPAQVLGIGGIRLRSRVGGFERYFTISEVYHISGFANLISIGQLGNKGVETRFSKRAFKHEIARINILNTLNGCDQ